MATADGRADAAIPPIEVATPQGPARLHVRPPGGASGSASGGASGRASGGASGRLVLGHGAGGGVGAGDLVAVARAASTAGWQVLLVEQPWRVAGRRVAVAPPRLDEAWLVVLDRLPELERGGALPGVPGPLVTGGRSAGARVACRTAQATGAAGVCCLSFPLHPPGRPDRSRAAELADAAGAVPVLAVQGRRDPFGVPDELRALGLPELAVTEVDGGHTPSRPAEVAAAVTGWLAALDVS
jgi:predicted alpha/beta-hydrolase family hydrolase